MRGRCRTAFSSIATLIFHRGRFVCCHRRSGGPTLTAAAASRGGGTGPVYDSGIQRRCMERAGPGRTARAVRDAPAGSRNSECGATFQRGAQWESRACDNKGTLYVVWNASDVIGNDTARGAAAPSTLAGSAGPAGAVSAPQCGLFAAARQPETQATIEIAFPPTAPLRPLLRPVRPICCVPPFF